MDTELPDRRDTFRDCVGLLRSVRDELEVTWDMLTDMEHIELLACTVMLCEMLNVAIDGAVDEGTFDSPDKVYDALLAKVNDERE